ncbi:MAG: DMT family transporter [Bacillota bacterium]
MKNKMLLSYLAIFFTVVMWGMSYLSIKVTVAAIPPMTLALERFLTAIIILIALLKILEPGSRLNKKDIPGLCLTGMVGITAYYFFQINGLKYTTASSASIIIATVPIFSILADYLFFKSPLSVYKVFCVLLSLAGVFLVVVDSLSGPAGRGSLAGNLLMLGTALCWVAYNIFTRPMGGKRSLLYIITYQLIFGTIFTLPFALLEMGSWQPVSAIVMLNVAFQGIFCTALGYYLYVLALKNLGTGIVTLFANLVPVTAVASSYFILKETITLTQIAGGVLIITSVYVASLKQMAEARATAQAAEAHNSL